MVGDEFTFPAEEVLEAAKEAALKEIVIIGVTEKEELYLSSSHGSLSSLKLMMAAGEILHQIALDEQQPTDPNKIN